MWFTIKTTLLGCLVAALIAASARSNEPAPKPTGVRGTDTRVSLKADAVTLNDLLKELSDQADLKLAAGAEVRWDQVSLRMRDRPAGRVMGELAELLNGFWERGTGERRTLGRDLRSRSYEEELRRRWYGGAVQELLDYAALAKRPPAYYVRLGEALGGKQPPDPRFESGFAMEVLTDPARHAALRLLLTLSREELLDMVSAGVVGYYLPWRRMAPEQRALALEVAKGLGPGGAWVQTMGLELDVHLWPGTPHPMQCHVRVANAFLPCGDEITYTHGPPAVRPGADTRGRPYPPRDPQRRGTGDEAAQYQDRYQDLEQMPFPARGFRQNYPLTWPEVFSQLGGRLPFALYSDYFAAQPFGQDPSYFAHDPDGEQNPPVVALEKISVAKALDALCARFGKIWWREGDALFFRSRTWFLDRLFQVPPPVLAALQHQLNAQGKLDRQGVELLAGLSGQQLRGLDLLVQEKLKRWVSWPADTMYRPLRAYAQLRIDQREQVLRPEGLPVTKMTPAQRYAYQEALLLCGSVSSVELVENPPTFRLEQTVAAGVPPGRPSVGELTFFLTDPAERQETPRRQWRVLASLHIPFPAEKEKAGAEGTERSR